MGTRNEGEVLAIRVIAMPRDTNGHGTIFGGYILSLIDQAGALAAHAGGIGKMVTVSMREVVFAQPVHVGDVITCFGRVLKRGRTSVTVCVRVVAQSPIEAQSEPREVTTAEVVYVQVDGHGRPMPLPPVA
ncbi:MAG: hotdog domain-containing protein [Myxococcota bacterium]